MTEALKPCNQCGEPHRAGPGKNLGKALGICKECARLLAQIKLIPIMQIMNKIHQDPAHWDGQSKPRQENEKEKQIQKQVKEAFRKMKQRKKANGRLRKADCAVEFMKSRAEIALGFKIG